jgi:hypothetical protein
VFAFTFLLCGVRFLYGLLFTFSQSLSPTKKTCNLYRLTREIGPAPAGRGREDTACAHAQHRQTTSYGHRATTFGAGKHVDRG